jgi:polyphosphate kinase
MATVPADADPGSDSGVDAGPDADGGEPQASPPKLEVVADPPSDAPEAKPAEEESPASADPGETSDEVGEKSRKFKLRSPQYYLNRELTWLSFNRRVLAEAEDKRTPLLERIKFLSIVAANLDEFFMKRIGGLKQQVGAGLLARTVDGRTPSEQIEDCYRVIHEMIAAQQELRIHLFKLLRRHNIKLVSLADLDADEQAAVREYYFENIFPLVTPQAIDPAHPFPFISNLSINLLVTVRYPNDEDTSLARVKVPIGAGIPRFLRIGGDNCFVPLEDVMANNLDLLFPGMEVVSCELFRVTRNANTERAEEQADDLLSMIESELRQRRFAPIVRLEVVAGMDPTLRGMLAAELGLTEAAGDVFEIDGMLGLGDLRELAGLDYPNLQDSAHHPQDHPRLVTDRNIFNIIREGPILLHHPYESFSSSVERFVREAGLDPKVRAIKVTLYRAASESVIINHLINAARNGKQVAVVVELKARFDEAANIRWANYLEEAGIHVTYGVVGLKTHCKTILVVRQDYNGLRRYAHIGTGNYHEGTARLYSDVGLLTCDDAIGRDLTELFNYLTTGYTPGRRYSKILTAPKPLKKALINKIQRQIAVHSAESPGLIQLKTNALEDVDIVRSLYRASQAGVTIDLIVRDSCLLRPQIDGLSDNIKVISIVGRFLEHSRLFYFRNGGDEEYYIGSADCMKRNLKSRVEVIAPVEDVALREELRFMLDAQINDHRSAWVMDADGNYSQRQPTDRKVRGSQQLMIDFAEKRFKRATRLKKRRPKSISGRNIR